jgi:hypothetical protein
VPWPEVEREHQWSDLLIGNGLSTHLWGRFGYRSLFTNACAAGDLDAIDRALFTRFDTENFERVLSALSTAIEVADTVGDPTDHLYERYASVKRALGEAVQVVHPLLDSVPYDIRESVRDILRDYLNVFTTSYDLLLYWCTGAGEGHVETFDGFKDRFWSNGRLEFDPTNAGINETFSTRILYLHGALHLAVNGAGVTRKRARGLWNLLEQVGLPDPNDPQERPLLITEGEAIDKQRAIQENDYLLFCQRRLRRQVAPLVVFGHSLSREDQHLIDAINRQPNRPVAVAIYDDGNTDIRARQAELRGGLKADDLFYFSSATHPLGAIEHSITLPPI